MSGELVKPARGQWVRLTLADGRACVCRFVRRCILRDGRRADWWYVNRGAYGVNRDDCYFLESTIVSATPATRPGRLLTYCDPGGKVHRVGRYESQEDADLAVASIAHLVSDIRLDAVA